MSADQLFFSSPGLPLSKLITSSPFLFQQRQSVRKSKEHRIPHLETLEGRIYAFKRLTTTHVLAAHPPLLGTGRSDKFAISCGGQPTLTRDDGFQRFEYCRQCLRGHPNGRLTDSIMLSRWSREWISFVEKRQPHLLRPRLITNGNIFDPGSAL